MTADIYVAIYGGTLLTFSFTNSKLPNSQYLRFDVSVRQLFTVNCCIFCVLAEAEVTGPEVPEIAGIAKECDTSAASATATHPTDTA